MTECFNSEFKEQLPELAAGTVEYPIPVEHHVASCSHCTAELEILRVVRQAAIPVPSIHVSKIVRALPPAPIPVREEKPWYRRASLQMAAAFLLVAGGLYSVRQAGDRMVASSSDVSVAAAPAAQVAQVQSSPDQAPPPAGSTAADSRAVVAQGAPRSDIALVTGLDEFTTQELSILLQDVDALAAVPVSEPDEFSPVNSNDVQGEG
ncbi:MAG: hypothetical protein H0W69_02185 [Gemmatimonadaceae bacterium]|nr:hypothetical protein [Gemmatimonadaceae bacterium]